MFLVKDKVPASQNPKWKNTSTDVADAIGSRVATDVSEAKYTALKGKKSLLQP